MGLLQEKHGETVELTLDWPGVRNAMGPEEARALHVALEQVRESATSVVICARGGAFCAGGNLPEILKLAEHGADHVRETVYGVFQGLFRTLRSYPVPIIAAVDGPAVGFGCDLALACTMTFIGKAGWLAQGWGKAGLIPATGGALYASEKGGPAAPWRLLLADRISASEAERMGLAIECENARTTALAAAQRLAALPQAPVRALVRLGGEHDFERHLDAALDAQVGFLTHPHFAEAARKLMRP